jgi:sporulation protein YlmC with PRC-barrel domain
MPLLSTRHAGVGPGARLSPAASLCGTIVLDDGGEIVGSIADLMLDVERGRLAYAVIATGGFVGVGEKLFAVPWCALRSAGRHFVLQGSRAALESGPSFDPDHWPTRPGNWWHERVHAHYRSRPYWE